MKRNLLLSILLAFAVIAAGCASKGFVRRNVDPVQAQVNQVTEQTHQQAQSINQLNKDLEETDASLSATKERVSTTETRVGDALARADRNSRDVSELRTELAQKFADLDDYRVAAEAAVYFDFDSDQLKPEGRTELDRLVADSNGWKRFFVAVEGFTDPIGPKDYNLQLSRRRADRVVQYLVTQHDIPIFRIHVIGLGSHNLVDDGSTREARAKSRRVEVAIFTTDPSVASARINE